MGRRRLRETDGHPIIVTGNTPIFLAAVLPTIAASAWHDHSVDPCRLTIGHVEGMCYVGIQVSRAEYSANDGEHAANLRWTHFVFMSFWFKLAAENPYLKHLIEMTYGETVTCQALAALLNSLAAKKTRALPVIITGCFLSMLTF